MPNLPPWAVALICLFILSHCQPAKPADAARLATQGETFPEPRQANPRPHAVRYGHGGPQATPLPC